MAKSTSAAQTSPFTVLKQSNFDSFADYTRANAIKAEQRAIAKDPSKSAVFQNNRTGDMVRADSNSPISKSQNYARVDGGAPDQRAPLAPGVYANRSQNYMGAQLGQAPLNPVTGRPSELDPKTLLSGIGTGAGTTGVSSGMLGGMEGKGTTEGGISTGTAGYYSDISGGKNGLSSYLSPAQTGKMSSFGAGTGIGGYGQGSELGGQPFNPGALAAQSQAGTLTPEQIAQSQLQTSLGGAKTGLMNAFQDYGATSNFLQNSFGQGVDLLKQSAGVGLNQAERTMDESLKSNEIEKQKAELEYKAAVEQISINRERENDYLMQKLASAGAVDSTGGVQIISRSAEKYDSILGNLAGQRQIALGEFALADSKVRNQFVSTIENITLQTQQLSTQLTQDFQSQMLSAQSTLRNAKGEANTAQQQAYTDYLSSLYGIQEAKKEAAAAAQAAALEAQQQSFENAISLAGLTGTYTDPFTGEQIRTLNGMKYDAEMAKAKASGSGSSATSSNDLSSLITRGVQLGVLSQQQVEQIMNTVGSSKSGISAEAQIWADMLSPYITEAEGNMSNALNIQSSPAGQLGGYTGAEFTKNLGAKSYDAKLNPFPYLNEPKTTTSTTVKEGNKTTTTTTK